MIPEKILILVLALSLILATIYFFSLKSFCGNYICEENENRENCCVDCGCSMGYECENNKCVALSKFCGNYICEENENCYYCPEDCKCGENEYCDIVEMKCVEAVCGNNICEPEFENDKNCCIDCYCLYANEICNITTKRCERLE